MLPRIWHARRGCLSHAERRQLYLTIKTLQLLLHMGAAVFMLRLLLRLPGRGGVVMPAAAFMVVHNLAVAAAQAQTPPHQHDR